MFVITQGFLGPLDITQGYAPGGAPTTTDDSGTGDKLWHDWRRRKTQEEEDDLLAIIGCLAALEVL